MKKLSLLVYIIASCGLILLGGSRIASDGVPLSVEPFIQAIKSLSITPTPTPPSPKTRETVQVKRAIDGDTIELSDGRRVRYIGIDSPELHHPNKKTQCFGVESAAYNTSLIADSQVQLERDISDTDRYGRLLRYVWKNNVLINDQMVAQGYALASTFPPDVAYADRFAASQHVAREQSRGLWGSCRSK